MRPVHIPIAYFISSILIFLCSLLCQGSPSSCYMPCPSYPPWLDHFKSAKTWLLLLGTHRGTDYKYSVLECCAMSLGKQTMWLQQIITIYQLVQHTNPQDLNLHGLCYCNIWAKMFPFKSVRYPRSYSQRQLVEIYEGREVFSSALFPPHFRNTNRVSTISACKFKWWNEDKFSNATSWD